MLKLGNLNINKAYLGSTEINKMYLGDTIVFDKTPMYLSYNPTTSLNLRIETASGDDWEIDWGDGVWERYVSSGSYATKTFGSSTTGVARVRSATGRGLDDFFRVQSTVGTWSFDATALSGLTSLTYLVLNSNSFTGDMSGVSGLTSLNQLQLIGSFTGDMTGVSGLTSLTFLRLESNGFTGDMTGVSGLTSLTFLRLESNGFTGNMSGVSGLTLLAHLFLNGTGLTGDMSGVSGLTSLTYLVLNSNSFTGDMSGVSGLTSLNQLQLIGSFTGDMIGVSGLTLLTYLRLDSNGFTLTYSTFTANLATLYLRLQTGELSNPVDIDQLIIDLDAVATIKTGDFDLRSSGAATPTAASSAARASLVSKGRTILTN